MSALPATVPLVNLVALVALAIALLALLRDRSEHSQNRAADVQGLLFNAGRSGIVTRDGTNPLRREYEPSVRASGPGTRYDVRTHLWVDDLVELKWTGEQKAADRFDNTSEPLSSKIEIDADQAERVWFGIAHNESLVSWVRGRINVRSQFIRFNLGTGEIQVWQWSRFTELRKWWQRQQRFTFWGGGTPNPLGQWKSRVGDTTHPRQFPTWDGRPFEWD